MWNNIMTLEIALCLAVKNAIQSGHKMSVNQLIEQSEN